MTSNGEVEFWRNSAACRHADPEIFFPIGTCGPAIAEIDRARKICAGRPARTRCLDWALAHGAAFGIWGGLAEHERRAVREIETHLRVLNFMGHFIVGPIRIGRG